MTPTPIGWKTADPSPEEILVLRRCPKIAFDEPSLHLDGSPLDRVDGMMVIGMFAGCLSAAL